MEDQLTGDHFCFGEGDEKCNFIEGSQEDALKYIIAHISQPSSVILDLTGLDSEHAHACMLIAVLASDVFRCFRTSSCFQPPIGQEFHILYCYISRQCGKVVAKTRLTFLN